MDDRIERPVDLADVPRHATSTEQFVAVERSPAQTPAERLHEALEQIRLNPPLKGFTTDEYMRLIRDDL